LRVWLDCLVAVQSGDDVSAGGQDMPGGKTRAQIQRAMKDRIKLAEAMGLDGFEHGDMVYIRQEGFNTPLRRFDPENDANDDYAVLKHMREQPDTGLFEAFCDEICHDEHGVWNPVSGFLNDHETGDYARAALKVMA
jgi:hypothetical protein